MPEDAQSDPQPPKKIIVDDDWKSRVDAEKAALQSGAPPATESPPEPGRPVAESPERRRAKPQLPPPSFELLVSMLVTDALIALGQIPLGKDQPAKFLPEEAKHQIDLLAVLEEKTRGNLSADESRLLTQTLHELRMAFIGQQSRS